LFPLFPRNIPSLAPTVPSFASPERRHQDVILRFIKDSSNGTCSIYHNTFVNKPCWTGGGGGDGGGGGGGGGGGVGGGH